MEEEEAEDDPPVDGDNGGEGDAIAHVAPSLALEDGSVEESTEVPICS